jgi:hypothetical protein
MRFAVKRSHRLNIISLRQRRLAPPPESQQSLSPARQDPRALDNTAAVSRLKIWGAFIERGV